MSNSYYFLSKESHEIDSICLGSGRFLRSVLVPALNGAGLKCAIFQTRGKTFLEYCRDRGASDNEILSYEVDTVEYNGEIKTENTKFYAAGTLGSKEGKDAVMNLLNEMKEIKIIGVGLTEAGLSSSSSKSLCDLLDILCKCHDLITDKKLSCTNPNGRICIINTDNVPFNGNKIRSLLNEIAQRKEMSDGFCSFLNNNVVSLNSMVDRITSQRPGSNGLVPKCEPVPAKALVIEDTGGDLPTSLCESNIKSMYGVVVRKEDHELKSDIALKLRVANGTHTALAHVMALSHMLTTELLSKEAKLLMKYIDAYFENQILPAAESSSYSKDETYAVYQDWRKRLCHPSFGLSTFFITQNGAAKAGIRIAPTIKSLVCGNQDVTVSTAFSLASILRFFTPSEKSPNSCIFHGWLDESYEKQSMPSNNVTSVTYADGMSYNLSQKWYEFKCNCYLQLPGKGESINLPNALRNTASAPISCKQPKSYENVISAFLTSKDGGDMKEVMETDSSSFRKLVGAISTLYARMVCNDGILNILREMSTCDGPFTLGFNTPCHALLDDRTVNDSLCPLHYKLSPIPTHSQLLSTKQHAWNNREVLASVIYSEVSSVLGIDLHTHLLPPSHGPLCLWGIDELLTYHYLVAEYFITAPASMTPVKLYSLSKRQQADIIWDALFVQRSPVSEACRGVITTITALGLSDAVSSRNLEAIRKFYHDIREKGEAGAEEFSRQIFRLAGLQYAIMTNIPFDINEAQHWRPKKKHLPDQYKSALRVDPLLAGDQKGVTIALKASGYDNTIEGARQYLRDWCDIIEPEYMMASTPHNFIMNAEGGNLSKVKKTGVNEEAMNTPFAFVDIVSSGDRDVECDGEEDDTASIINETSDLLSLVLMKVCEERDLPIALKIGAHRGVNPRLLQAGDGVVAFADAGVLARLCTRFPRVRFLATFLSRNNQHEACVLASKFRNLHIYGCWWFCNNPSIIKEITKMRVEMLGVSSFTAQHSDARVLDQLVYKWAHSRSVIAQVLEEEYWKLSQSGWVPNRGEVRRDVARLFGGSYREFMSKSLL